MYLKIQSNLSIEDTPYSGHLSIADTPYSGHLSIADTPYSGHLAIADTPYSGHLSIADTPYSGHLSVADIFLGPDVVRYREVSLYFPMLCLLIRVLLLFFIVNICWAITDLTSPLKASY